jgi:hypothetical protein
MTAAQAGVTVKLQGRPLFRFEADGADILHYRRHVEDNMRHLQSELQWSQWSVPELARVMSLHFLDMVFRRDRATLRAAKKRKNLLMYSITYGILQIPTDNVQAGSTLGDLLPHYHIECDVVRRVQPGKFEFRVTGVPIDREDSLQ